MARTHGQVIRDILGEKDFTIADLTAKLEDATEKAAALQSALDEAVKAKGEGIGRQPNEDDRARWEKERNSHKMQAVKG